MTLHVNVHTVCRLGSKSQAKKKGVKSNLRKEFDRMATSGGWDNDDEDDEQNDSAEEMDIDQAAGGSAAASGIPMFLPVTGTSQYVLCVVMFIA